MPQVVQEVQNAPAAAPEVKSEPAARPLVLQQQGLRVTSTPGRSGESPLPARDSHPESDRQPLSWGAAASGKFPAIAG